MTTDTPAAAQPGFFARLFAPPTRLAALLPDGRFFLRLVPVEPEGDAASVAEQVALALETLAPFPIAQLYYGHYWQPGSPRALVYAVYRKRFPADETAGWSEAQVVLPAFTTLLVEPPEPGTARVLTSPDAVTVFHWGDDAFVPSQALIHPFSPEVSESDRAAAREQLLRSLATAPATVEDWDYPELRRVNDAGDVTFSSGGRELRVSANLAAALDVRDNEEIAERRAIQRRDIILWRVALGMAALVLLCGVAEGALAYSNSQIRQGQILIAQKKPKQSELIAIEANTHSADVALSRRLYPLEMLMLAVDGGRLPPSVTITNAQANLAPGTFKPTLTLNATASIGVDQGYAIQEATKFQHAVEGIPGGATVTLSSTGGGGGGGNNPRGNNTPGVQQLDTYSFRLLITFNQPVAAEDSGPAAVAAPSAPKQP